jgi:sugar transferase (PEP-CTERM/EpsH1 system associated)
MTSLADRIDGAWAGSKQVEAVLPNILMLTHRVPYPPDKGDRIRTFHILRELGRRSAIHLACLADEPIEPGVREVLEGHCHRVAIVPLGRGRWVRALGSLALGRTATEGAFVSAELRATLRRWARDTRFRAMLASSSGLVPYLRDRALRDVPAVVDLMDLDSQKWLDYAEADRGPRRWAHRLEGRRLRRLERGLTSWARAITLVSDAEAELYRRCCGDGPVHAVTNGVDLDYFRPSVTSDESGCVFVGALDYRPNVDAATWFCRQVWPEIRRRLPAARFALVGRSPSEEVRQLAAWPGVELVGQVADVRPYVARAAVVVAPLQIARGVQNKVLEAMAMGKAVVASPQALDGLGAAPGTDLLAASTPDAWSAAVAQLLGDAALRRRLGDSARRYVERRHRWDTCLVPFGTLLGLSDATAPRDSQPEGS